MAEEQGDINNTGTRGGGSSTDLPLLTKYEPLRRRAIRSEIRRLRTAAATMDALWQSEVEAYEGGGGGESERSGAPQSRPSQLQHVQDDPPTDKADLRNYPNPTGTVDNPSLFPYHTALYPLLDVYYHLLPAPGRVLPPTSVDRDVVPPSYVFDLNRRSPPGEFAGVAEEAAVPGYLPNSAYAVYASLLPRYRARDQFWQHIGIVATGDLHGVGRAPQFIECDRFDFLREWETELWTEQDEQTGIGIGIGIGTKPCKYGPDALPKDAQSRADVLTRVLRHSISDLQKDHRLGRAAMLLMTEFRVFDDCDDDRKHGLDDGDGDGQGSNGNNDHGRGGGGCGGTATTSASASASASDGNSSGAARLRRLLSVLASEYVNGCDWNCHARYLEAVGDDDQLPLDPDSDEDDEEGVGNVHAPTHYCDDWKNLLRTLSTVILNGVTYVTEAHAEVVSAFALAEYDGASGAAAAMDETYFEGGVAEEEDGTVKTATEDDGGANVAKAGDGRSGESGSGGGVGSDNKPRQHPSAKALLKQNLFYFNNTAGFADGQGGGAAGDGGAPGQQTRVPSEPFRLSMVYAIVDGLGWHATKDRRRLKVLAERDADGAADGPAHLLLLRRTVDSYQNCIRALVAIGESTVRRLPPNSRTMSLGGALVRALVLASVDHDPAKVPSTGYIGRCIADEADSKCLICPTRYADAITNAAASLRSFKDSSVRGPSDGTEALVGRILESPPHKDVQDVLRGLFLRDLVDTKISGCGYGDAFLWCGLPITPLDPLLFDHVSNYPDSDQDTGEWGVDEEGLVLSGHQLAARYDFTLLMMQRAWQAPWTPQSHRSFSYHHRQAIVALSLCAQRVGFPSDLLTIVNSFLPRCWWPDDRRQCWCHDCQLGSLSELLRNKVIAREGLENKGKNDPLEVPAPATMHNISLMRPAQAKNSMPSTVHVCDCSVALFCSKEHKKYLMQDGHKRACGTPPFRVPGVDEELLCREVFGTAHSDTVGDDTLIKEDDVEDEIYVEEDDDDEDDDDGSWESIESDEDDFAPPELKTRTEIIYKFFDKAYKVQELQRPDHFGHIHAPS